MGAEQESGMGQKFNKDEKLKHSLSPNIPGKDIFFANWFTP
jgi:hypothetical protein